MEQFEGDYYSFLKIVCVIILKKLYLMNIAATAEYHFP